MPAECGWGGERARLERVYAWREATLGRDAVAWSWLRPEVHWLDVSLQQFLLTAWRVHGWTQETIATCRLLDVGCGTGRWLRWCYDAGLRDLWGVELIGHRVVEATQTAPFARIVHANMAALPFPDRTFDCIVQCTAFSSCVESRVRTAAAREMLRVLQEDGCILWCDFPRTSAAYLVGMDAGEIRRLFPEAAIQWHRVGVKPQWLGALTSVVNQGLWRSAARQLPGLRHQHWCARRPITKFPHIAAALLERCPWALCYLNAVIRKRPTRQHASVDTRQSRYGPALAA